MKLGFLGTGNISSDVITGICNSNLSFKKIIVSPRNRNKTKSLKKKFRNKIIIAKSNQDVINNSDWVFLGILPEVGEKILPELKFRSNQIIVSFMSTIIFSKLKKIINNKAQIVRAIPMPPISIGKGPVALYPSNKKVKFFFNKIGTSIEIKSEKLLNNFWAISGTMAQFYELLKILSDWLVKRGLKRSDAQKYVTSLYLALAKLAVVHSSKNLKKFVLESQTPGGLNSQGVKELRKSGYFKSLEKTVNNILKRLNKA
jgi:Pyrroline-5-carboxylate reductase